MTADLLLHHMAEDMHIAPAQREDKSDFVLRVLYSAASRWMIAATVETCDGTCGSIVHIKREVENKLAAYAKIYTSICLLPDDYIEKTVDTLFENHEAVGSFYRIPNRAAMARTRYFVKGSTALIRAPALYEKCSSSGAGFYREGSAGDALADDYVEAFSLLPQPPSDLLRQLQTAAGWVSAVSSAPFEYFQPQRKYGAPYYGDRRPRGDEIVLARTVAGGVPQYYLLWQEKQRIFPSWEVTEGYPRAAMCALQHEHHCLKAVVNRNSAFVEIHLSCMLPQREEAFFRHFSWPVQLENYVSRWDFQAAPAVYPFFEERLVLLGFTIEEENA